MDSFCCYGTDNGNNYYYQSPVTHAAKKHIYVVIAGSIMQTTATKKNALMPLYAQAIEKIRNYLGNILINICDPNLIFLR